MSELETFVTAHLGDPSITYEITADELILTFPEITGEMSGLVLEDNKDARELTKLLSGRKVTLAGGPVKAGGSLRGIHIKRLFI